MLPRTVLCTFLLINSCHLGLDASGGPFSNTIMKLKITSQKIISRPENCNFDYRQSLSHRLVLFMETAQYFIFLIWASKLRFNCLFLVIFYINILWFANHRYFAVSNHRVGTRSLITKVSAFGREITQGGVGKRDILN